jgi:hypothetical protein
MATGHIDIEHTTEIRMHAAVPRFTSLNEPSSQPLYQEQWMEMAEHIEPS